MDRTWPQAKDSARLAETLRQQVEAVLDYAIAQGAQIAYAGTENLPSLSPPEDEQNDQYCSAVLTRLLRWAPAVSRRWTYGGATPTLVFSRPGHGDGGGTVAINATNGTLASFKSDPRYDLLAGKVHVDYLSESEVQATDASTTGKPNRIWSVLATDQSVANNGSRREIAFTIDLRGASLLRDPDTGERVIAQEDVPTGVAAALHAPFAVLTHSLQWSQVGEDVDWTLVPGMTATATGGSGPLIGGAGVLLLYAGPPATPQATIQTITRDLGTGTTTVQAGPPAQLGINDLIALQRPNRTRNAARAGGGGGGGGYNAGGGPGGQDKGEKPPTGPAPLPQHTFDLVVNGEAARAIFNATAPTA